MLMIMIPIVTFMHHADLQHRLFTHEYGVVCTARGTQKRTWLEPAGVSRAPPATVLSL